MITTTGKGNEDKKMFEHVNPFNQEPLFVPMETMSGPDVKKSEDVKQAKKILKRLGFYYIGSTLSEKDVIELDEYRFAIFYEEGENGEEKCFSGMNVLFHRNDVEFVELINKTLEEKEFNIPYKEIYKLPNIVNIKIPHIFEIFGNEKTQIFTADESALENYQKSSNLNNKSNLNDKRGKLENK